jgi:type I restriction enzyme S subunit
MKATLHRVSDIADQIRGVTYRKQDASTSPAADFLPVLRAGNITDEGLTYNDLVYVPSSKISAKQMVRKDDIVIAASSGSINIVGKAARALEDFEGGFGAFCKILRPNKNVNPAYFSHFFKTTEYRQKVSFLAEGASINNLRNEDLNGLQIPLPPLSEQKRIAKILDATDTLRAKRREALSQLDTLLQSTFLEMFGNPVANNWKMATVENVVKDGKGMIRTGPFGSQLLRSEFVDEGIPVLGIDNAVTNVFQKGAPRFITPQKYEQLRRYTVTPGDVLITIMGTCGRCAIVPDGIGVAINTKHLCCITLNQEKCLPEFMHSYFLRHPIARRYLEQNAKGAIMSGMNMGIIKALPIPLPPLTLQTQFATIVNSVEQQKSRMKTHLTELDTLFASLQQRAFNGEL